MLNRSILLVSSLVLISGCSSTGNVLSSIAEEMMKPACQSHADRLTRYLKKEPTTQKQIVDAMREGRVLRGMSSAQAKVAWGSRDTTKVDQYGLHWKWKYSEPKGQWITFDRGVVVSASTYGSPFPATYWSKCN